MTYPSAPEPDQPASPYGQPVSPPASPYDPPAPHYGQAAPGFEPPTSAQPGQYPPAPAYGQAGPYALPPTLAPTGTNGFAIASLIFGILGGVLFSVIFGIVALTQIRKRNQTGKGLAVAGLVLSVVWMLVCGAGVVVAIVTDSGNGGSPSALPSLSAPKSSDDLKAGDCVNGVLSINLDEKLWSNPPAVACATPHEAEVIEVIALHGQHVPGRNRGEEAVRGRLLRRARRVRAAGEDFKDLEVYYLYPTSSSWATGDRDIICLAVSEKTKLTGSLKG